MAETLPLLASYLLKALPIGNRSGCSKNRGQVRNCTSTPVLVSGSGA
jgi:hypothetical protein